MKNKPRKISALFTLGDHTKEGVQMISLFGGKTCSTPKQVPSSSVIQHDMKLIAVDTEIFCFGGRSPPSSGVRMAWKYDLTTDTWFQLASMTQGRGSPMVTKIGQDKLLITGKILRFSKQ